MGWGLMVMGAVVFAVFSAAAWVALQRWWPDAGEQRLATAADAQRAAMPQRGAERLPRRVLQALGWLSQWSLPRKDSTDERGTADAASVEKPLRLRLLQAGWRSRHAIGLYGGAKTSLLVLAPLLWASLAWTVGLHSGELRWWAILLASAAGAYLLPDLALRWQLARRQRALFRAFPDAMDLLRVCVQAGLGLDAAIDRVGREMRLASPLLAEEWQLTSLELRAGAARSQALRHLAERVGLSEVDALVTMLVQADRFGTRMSEALQVHADALRTQRRLKAEEAAAQLPVKLLIPLVFCIFPALLAVMLGPVGISLYRHFAAHGGA
ncbi:MAG: type secretion system domain protein [Pseudomonadota bacterium]